MKPKTTPFPQPEIPDPEPASDHGRRIRWERDAEHADRLVVLAK
jgi:hypothetical protein